MYTESKPYQRGKIIPPFFLLIFLIFSLDSTGQKISKYYTTNSQSNGTLYFIEPDHEFENDSFDASLTWDLTHLSTTDSVRMNFSFRGEEIMELDCMILVPSETIVCPDMEKLFVEDEKRKWVHRYSAVFSLEELKEFYQLQEPNLMLYAGNLEIPFTIKERKWDKATDIMNRIFAMIDAN